MDPQREELLSALRDAEEFVSVTLVNEPLSADVEMKRQELQATLKSCMAGYRDDDEQEIYDDVLESKESASPEENAPQQVLHLDGTQNESTEDNDGPLENYEDMSVEESEEIYDDTVIPEDETPKDEIYDDTVPEASQTEQEETYEVPEAEKPCNEDQDETEENYEGVEECKQIEISKIKNKSGTQELESLMKPIRPEEVEGAILKGYLDKHRKKGIYIGSKWQKRYCVLRSFVLYYYVGVNSISQKGSIILPGYTVTVHSKNKKEFILTRGEDRSYTFMARTKEDADTWIEAIEKAASTSKISKRQSEILEQLRLSGEGEEDTSSIVNETLTNEGSFEENYDDVDHNTLAANTTEVDSSLDADQGDYEVAESSSLSVPPQPVRPSKPPPPPTEDDDQELYDDLDVGQAPPQPERPPPQPERPPPQPERPSQPQRPPPQPKGPPTQPEGPPPQLDRPPKRPVSEIQPTTEDDEDFYDDVGAPPPLPPPSAIPKRPVTEINPNTEEEEDEDIYDDVGVQGAEDQPAESKPTIPNRQLPPVPANDGKPSPPLTPRLSGPPVPTPSPAPKPAIPSRITGQDKENNNDIKPDIPSRIPHQGFKTPEEQHISQPSPPTESKTLHKAPPPQPPVEEEPEIDYNCIYQALWDCKPDAADELEFSRGDLLYIYEKPHQDWWIGSKYKPQGYETRLIPTNFIMLAYEL